MLYHFSMFFKPFSLKIERIKPFLIWGKSIFDLCMQYMLVTNWNILQHHLLLTWTPIVSSESGFVNFQWFFQSLLRCCPIVWYWSNCLWKDGLQLAAMKIGSLCCVFCSGNQFWFQLSFKECWIHGGLGGASSWFGVHWTAQSSLGVEPMPMPKVL